MIPKKLLIGGTVAVGSVATAAVVTNKYGFPSSTASGENNPLVQTQQDNQEKTREEESLQEINLNLEKITEWFDENIGKGKWEVKIRNNEGDGKLEKSDPEDLLDYLNFLGTKELLKSLASPDKTTTFIFKYEEHEKNWENIFTQEQILAWVKNTSGDKATLKLEKDLSSIDSEDLGGLFDSLEREKTLFNSGLGDYSEKNKKTILFEEYAEKNKEIDWIHSKTEIKKLGDNNNFEIKIKKGTGVKTLNKADEGDLVGLLVYLDSKDQKELFEYLSPTEEGKISLTLKNNSDNWELVHDSNTINDWVSHTSNNKAKLELYIGNSKQELSKINDDDELKQLFTALPGREKNLFEENLNGYDEENQKTIIFEKVGSDWKHIKEAIEGFASDKYTLKIKINGDDPKEIDENVKDKELIGLLRHIQDNVNKAEYKKENGYDDLVLEKNKSGEWQLSTTPAP